MSDGSPSAYFGTCLSGFPNFFMMMGPNTITGHLSVIYTVECQINFTMRLIRPIIASTSQSRSWFWGTSYTCDKIGVTAEAERADNDWIQRKAKELVWNTGCTSWFIDPKTGRNTQMYPDWQYKFWARSIWVPYKNFVFGNSEISISKRRNCHRLLAFLALLGIGITINGYREASTSISRFLSAKA